MKRIILPLLTAICLFSCQMKHEQNNVQLLDQQPGVSPFLAKDIHGNLVVSWAKIINDSTSIFCYAISKDDGKTFGQPIIIPSSDNLKPHAENLPKIIFKPSGEIIALWGSSSQNPKNKYAGSVFYAQSFDQGKSWSNRKALVTDTAGYDQRYFDIDLLSNGEVAIIWLDNRKTGSQEGSALYYASTHQQHGFMGERKISENCCQCCRTDLYIDRQNNIHALFRGIIQDSIRDMVHIHSSDQGQHFTTPKRIAQDNWVLKACPHTGPSMTENEKGIHFSWYTGGDHKGAFYTNSKDNGSSFALKETVSSSGKHPQITTDKNGQLFIVWDEITNASNNVVSQIGIQSRQAEGKEIYKKFITDNSSFASYPVVSINKKNKPFVAYTVKKGEKNYIAYQTIE